MENEIITRFTLVDKNSKFPIIDTADIEKLKSFFKKGNNLNSPFKEIEFHQGEGIFIEKDGNIIKWVIEDINIIITKYPIDSPKFDEEKQHKYSNQTIIYISKQ